MDIRNPFTLLRNISKKPPTIPSSVLDTKPLSDDEKKLLQRIGITTSQLQQDINADTQVQWDRQRFSHEINRALEHPIIGAAVKLYADCATLMSPIHNASVWITSDSPKYQKELSNLLDSIGIEEKIFDWAWTVAAFGDLFVQINGLPSLGIVSVNDDRHPIQISRVDHNGILIGFYETPLHTTTEKKLIEPWKYVHLRLLGAKRKRPLFSDPNYAEYRSQNIMMGADVRQVSSRYGASLLIDSIPTYKRLRLAEDSLLLARMTRGILRYVWKLAVDSTSMEAVNEIMDQIAVTLKRARALNTSASSPYYDSKENPLGVTEDIFLPVWGETGNLECEEIGGKPDIRWIVDIEDLRNQLACTLRTPLVLLGGYVDEASGSLGSEAIEKLDIGFARNARRLQRALKEGIKRICQIHLAYMNMDPDPALFEVNMAESNTAESESLKNALETGVDIVDRFIETIQKIDPEVDLEEVFNYLNRKILKLEDFDLSQFRKTSATIMDKKEEDSKSKDVFERYPISNTDLISYVPLESKEVIVENKKQVVGPKLQDRGLLLFNQRWAINWAENYSQVSIIETKGGKKPTRQMTFEDLQEKQEEEVESEI